MNFSAVDSLNQKFKNKNSNKTTTKKQENRVRVEHSYSKVFFFSISYLSFYDPIVHKLNILITCENKPVWFDVFCLFLCDGQSVTSFKKEKNEFHFYFARISFPIVSCFVLEEKARCLVSIRSPIFFLRWCTETPSHNDARFFFGVLVNGSEMLVQWTLCGKEAIGAKVTNGSNCYWVMQLWLT